MEGYALPNAEFPPFHTGGQDANIGGRRSGRTLAEDRRRARWRFGEKVSSRSEMSRALTPERLMWLGLYLFFFLLFSLIIVASFFFIVLCE